MKHIIFTCMVLLVSAMTGEAMANCTNNQVQRLALALLLRNNTVCQAPSGDEQYGAQEEHRVSGVLANGQLWDYKRGPASTIDPPTQIGTWAITGLGANTVVSYTYLGGGGSGTYKVYNNNNGSYDFCNGATRVATVSVANGLNGCPGFPHGAP